MGRRRVAMVLNSAGLGGVPAVVRAIVARLPHDLYEPHVFLLKPGNEEGMRAMEAAGIVPVVPDTASGKTSVIAQLADWLSQERIDILHTHSFRPNLYGRMAGAICRPDGLRIISQYHNQYEEKWRAEPHALLLERRLVGVTDAMVAVSDAVRDHVATTVGLPFDRVSVIRNGVDLERFSSASGAEGRRRLGLTEHDFAIGLAGRICRQKGQDVFLDAARQLSDLPKARFLMIGDEEDAALTARLREEISQAGLGHRISMTGHVADLAEVIAGLDLLVMPSRWEGLPLVLLEAMAAGTPVIATRVGGTPEVVGEFEAAWLIPPGDAGQLAQAIRYMAGSPAARMALAEAGRSRAEAFSWDVATRKLARLYDALFEEEGR